MKFNPESSLFQFLGSLFDFILLNAVFLLSCIPIITIGPAISALFAVTMQEARGEHSYILHSYIKALKKNFKTALSLFVLYSIAGAVLIFNFSFWLQLKSMLSNIALLIITLCAVLYLLSLLYVFALLARFENSLKQTIKNSILLALTNQKQTLLLAVIILTASVLTYATSVFRIFLVIFGFAFAAYCASFPLTNVFRLYEPDDKTDSD